MLARVRNTAIYFDIDGSGLVPAKDRMVPRPALILLHGGPGGDHASYKMTHRPLTDVAQLVYVDHRGCGRSARCDPATCTLENNIDDLDALRDHLGLEQICVLGTSYGGMVAQGYALKYPDRVSRLILVCTAPSYRFLAEAQAAIESRGSPEQIAACRTLWDGNFQSPEQLRDYFRVMGSMYSTTFKPEDFDASYARGIRNHEALNLGFKDFLRTYDYIDDLHKIQCETLVIAGAHDWICLPSQSRLIAEKVPRAHLKVFANSSHMIAADETSAYLDAVRGFLVYAPHGQGDL